MAKDYDGDGVWRTINGRRVFIAEGQSLGDAMKKSGKFGKVSKIKGSRKNTFKDEISQGDKNKFAMGYGLSKDAVKGYAKARQDERNAKKNEYTRDELKAKYGTDNVDLINAGKEKENRVSLSEKQVKEGNRLNEKSKSMAKEDIQTYLGGNKSNWDNDDDFVRDLANEHNLDYKEAKKMFDDSNKNNGSSDWRAQVKANNEKMEKDVTDLENKINEYRTRSANSKDALESYQLLKEADRLQNQYYERFRENERANAKLKQEQPNEKYEYVDSYATYKDKFKDAFGEDGSGDDYVSAKMYTNDEFMEHLEDSNWHSERKQLEQANLTNQELSYIKDHTKVGAWSVGEELTGKANVEKMINEAKAHSSNKSINDAIRSKASKTKADSNIDKGWDDEPKSPRKNINYTEESPVLKRAFGRMNSEQMEKTYDARLKAKGEELDDQRAFYTKKRMNDIVDKSSMGNQKKESVRKNIESWQPAKNDQELKNRYSEDIAYLKGALPNQTDAQRMNSLRQIELNRIGHMLGGHKVYDYRNGQKVDDARNLQEDTKSTSKIFNDAVKTKREYKAWEKYKKIHPNSKITLTEFRNKYKG